LQWGSSSGHAVRARHLECVVLGELGRVALVVRVRVRVRARARVRVRVRARARARVRVRVRVHLVQPMLELRVWLHERLVEPSDLLRAGRGCVVLLLR